MVILIITLKLNKYADGATRFDAYSINAIQNYLTLLVKGTT